ncbi:hypothetical protein NC653_019859 [Populus alba x Populus x berolinensis]|uniref:Uncharacterized protein n=1 Tax=Populus alba x Populus x berolinensis TaxID=444605 RepID=A0AAD6MJ62_9ROSI|nr:hypothetical protein NC653_019859 [Populus alba x Populus x berolinensis]
MSLQTSRNVNSIPKKSSMTRTFNSSMTKINGVANSKGADSLSVWASTKVQDLRQQIALRERELKLKAAAQNKESGSVSDKSSHINDNSSQPDTSRMQMDPCVVLNQTPLLTNANASTLSKKRGTVNVAEHNSIDIQLLVEMEESLDRELEEAQEHRHKCEIEERNALKAYRKAQRALIEANSR